VHLAHYRPEIAIAIGACTGARLRAVVGGPIVHWSLAHA
jgi:hypothetical protein